MHMFEGESHLIFCLLRVIYSSVPGRRWTRRKAGIRRYQAGIARRGEKNKRAKNHTGSLYVQEDEEHHRVES